GTSPYTRGGAWGVPPARPCQPGKPELSLVRHPQRGEHAPSSPPCIGGSTPQGGGGSKGRRSDRKQNGGLPHDRHPPRRCEVLAFNADEVEPRRQPRRLERQRVLAHPERPRVQHR